MRAAGFSMVIALLMVGWTQQPSDKQEPVLTLGPQVMTYEELADALSTDERRVVVAPRLKQGAALVYLKNRPWREAVQLLEYGLELKFTLQTDSDGVVYWLMERDPEVLKRDARFFDQYVRVATRTIQMQLRRYDDLLTRPLDELQKEYLEKGGHSPNLPELPEDFTMDTPLPAAYLEAVGQWTRLLWAQSLDGYVMLRWMRQRWNEALTRRLLLERGLIMLQPRALGVEGLPDEGLREFLRGAGEEEDYNLVIGVVGWHNCWRMIIPFCDLISPYDEGTGWLLVPIMLRTEPPVLESLFEQMGKETHAHFLQLSQRQAETLSGYKPAEKPFQVRDAHALSEVLERFAKELDHEVLMELAPEREMLVLSGEATSTQRRLYELLRVSQSLFAEEDEASLVLFLLMVEYLTEPSEQNITTRQMLSRWAESLVGVWRYELRDGVLVARNLMAFLDRQYRYPLKELLQLERTVQAKRSSSDTALPIEWRALARFAHAVYRQPDANLPALIDYRFLGRLDGDDMMRALPAIVLLDRQPHRARLLQQLCAGQEVSLPTSSLGIEGINRAVRLWRMNVFHEQLQPFGFWRAWHPDFVAILRQGQFRYTLSEDRDSVFVAFTYAPPWQKGEFSFSVGSFPLDCPARSKARDE